MKGLPLAYSKDMQDDKQTTFDAFDSLDLSLQRNDRHDRHHDAEQGAHARQRLVRLLDRHRPRRLARAQLNIPFREAHHVTGAAVKAAETAGIALPDLPLGVLQKLEPRITDKVFAVLTVDASVASRQSYGGTAPARVREQIAAWKAKLDQAPNDECSAVTCFSSCNMRHRRSTIRKASMPRSANSVTRSLLSKNARLPPSSNAP